MQVVRWCGCRGLETGNISPVSDLGPSGGGCPPLFLPLSVRKTSSRKPKTGALPGGRCSIIITMAVVVMEKQESSPRFGRAPGFVFVTARLGPIRQRCPMDRRAIWQRATDDEPLTIDGAISRTGPCTYHVPCCRPQQPT